MSVDLQPLGTRCNLQCLYCYQNPQRETNQNSCDHSSYDMEAIQNSLGDLNVMFNLFGGEPLLLPFDDLEKIVRWGKEKFGRSSIQTNGALLTQSHIDLFNTHNVLMGISIDGPGELNDLRWAGSLSKTRAATVHTEKMIETLLESGNPICLIITLHKQNATKEKLPKLVEWCRKLDAMGLQNARLHILDHNDEAKRQRFGLTLEENLEAFAHFYHLQQEMQNIHFDIFDDMEYTLRGKDSETTCSFMGCDPYTNRAVISVEGDGSITHCGRVNKEGINFLKAETEGFERYISLFLTPKSEGGCGGCRFFLFCKGQCPGTSAQGDWRNKSEYCAVWNMLFEKIENRMVQQGETPLSLAPEREELENRMLFAWTFGANPLLEYQLGQLESQRHQPKNETSIGERTASHNASKPSSLVLTLHHNDNQPSVKGLGKLNQKGSQEERSPFALHDFLRLKWSDERAREVWEPRLNMAAEWLLAIQETISTPPCCLKAYHDQNTQPDDLMWPPFSSTHPEYKAEQGDTSTLKLPYEERPPWNPLLAPLGLYPLAHLPCKLECKAAAALIEDTFQKYLEEEGARQNIDWLRMIHSWPMEYSSLRGIAEVKTPIFKFIHNAKTAFNKKVVQLRGSSRPVEGAIGLSFPFQNDIPTLEVWPADKNGNKTRRECNQPIGRLHPQPPNERAISHQKKNEFISM